MLAYSGKWNEICAFKGIHRRARLLLTAGSNCEVQQLQMGSNTSNDLEPVVLVDQTSAGELSNKTMAKDFFEAALVMVVAAGGRIILPSHINQNVHVLPYCRITAANRAHLTKHATHRGKSHPRVASVTQTHSLLLEVHSTSAAHNG